MIPNRSRSVGWSFHRGSPSGRLRVAMALLGLTLVGLTQAGCRSNGCSSCNIGQKINNGVQGLRARVFPGRSGGGGCSTCGTLGAYEEGVVVDSGVPMAVPGGVVVPGPAATIPPPAIESEAGPELRALPPAAGSAPGGSASNRSPSGTNRSAYEAIRPKNELVASKRGGDLARAYRSPAPEPAAYSADQPDILDNLPPVDLPPDIGRKVTPLDDPARALVGPPGKADDPIPDDSAPPVVPVTDSNTKTTSVEPGSAEDRPVAAIARIESVAPARSFVGISRAIEVAPQLMGGSLPGSDGLAALKRTGCRTLVDLRPPAEVAAGFADQVIDQGMTYLPLPFAVDPINPARLDRFNEVLAQANIRPIYFCDGDGRRAGLAWYLRLRLSDKVDAASARKQAEKIGLVAADLPGADRFLADRTVVPGRVTSASAAPRVTWGDLEPVAPAPAPAPAPAVVVVSEPAIVAAMIPPAGPVTLPPTPSLPSIESRSGVGRDQPFDRNASWRPVAALVLSGLGVPLAYWSRTALGQMRTPRRASLTAKGNGPRKALPSSDA